MEAVSLVLPWLLRRRPLQLSWAFVGLCVSGMNKGFAFVTYKSMEDVATVLQSEVTVDGRPLSIKLASQQDQGAAMKSGPSVDFLCNRSLRNARCLCDNAPMLDLVETR